MKSQINRRAVDLSAYPNLVVIYLGMRVNTFTGIKTVLGLGPQISKRFGTNPKAFFCIEASFSHLRQYAIGRTGRNFNSCGPVPDPFTHQTLRKPYFTHP